MFEVKQGEHIFSTANPLFVDWALDSDRTLGILTNDFHSTPQPGKLVNSGIFDNFSPKEVRTALIEKAEKEGFGKRKINYKLRDWIFSRQRYWGEPMPIIHLKKDSVEALPKYQVGNTGASLDFRGEKVFLFIDDKELSEVFTCAIDSYVILDYSLPLTLPEVEKYEPSDDGRSPLANVTDWVNIRLADNLVGERETNTMPQWAGSCWYYLRFMDPHNADALASQEALQYWGQVDHYVGGAEHAVLHLLYARFWHKVLFDLGIVPHSEPFQKLTNQGLILGPDGQKMSKSKGNVINPNDIVSVYGADTFRMYEMSMADFRDPAPWNTDSMVGIARFLDRVWAAFTENTKKASDDMRAYKMLHKTIKKVSTDIEEMKFNTAISALIIMLNEGIPTDSEMAQEWKEGFALMLHPFAPHIAEELWSQMGKAGSIYGAQWPEYEESLTIDDDVTIAVQVAGKLRGTFTFLRGVAQEEVAATVYESDEIKKWIDGKEIIKEIWVPNKLFGIVIK